MARGLRVDRAVMIASPSPRSKPRDEDWANAWAERQISRGADPEVALRASDLARRHDMVKTGLGPIEQDLPVMTAPALILHSEDDPQCPFGNSVKMADLWPGSSLFLLEGLGHRPIAQNAAVIERAINFVEGMT